MELRLSEENNMENGNKENPAVEGFMDYEQESKGTLSTTIRKTVDLSDVTPVHPDNNQFILLLSSVLLYLSIFVYAGVMIWVSRQPAIDLQANTMQVSWVASLCELFIIVDLVIVCVCYKKKGWLIFLAIVFPVFYPMQRAKHVEREEGVGKLCTCVWAISAAWMLVFMVQAFSSYGLLIAETDAKTRAELAIVMDQTDENGQRYGDMINDKVLLGGGVVESQGDMQMVVLVGSGRVNIDNNYFVLLDDYQVDTQLGFVKNENGAYELQAAIIGNRELAGADANSYWKNVIQKYKNFQ